jgi:hypothetical protein
MKSDDLYTIKELPSQELEDGAMVRHLSDETSAGD